MTASVVVFDREGQGYAFPEDGLPPEYSDAKSAEIQQVLEKAQAEAERAKGEKQEAASIYKSKERALHYAQVIAQMDDARITSVKYPGQVYVALDHMGALSSIRGRNSRDYSLTESSFYGAYLDGAEISVAEAAEMDMDEDEEDKEGEDETETPEQSEPF